FDDQAVSVVMDPLKGRLYSYSSALSAPHPSILRIDIPREQAIATARQLLVSKSWTVNKEPAAALRIVMPNDFWQSYFSRPQNDMPWYPKRKPLSRLAWVVRATVEGVTRVPTSWDVWVDAISGRVIGGEDRGAIRGDWPKAALASLSLVKQLNGARR